MAKKEYKIGCDLCKDRVAPARIFYRQIKNKWCWLCPDCWEKQQPISESRTIRASKLKPEKCPKCGYFVAADVRPSNDESILECRVECQNLDCWWGKVAFVEKKRFMEYGTK